MEKRRTANGEQGKSAAQGKKKRVTKASPEFKDGKESKTNANTVNKHNLRKTLLFVATGVFVFGVRHLLRIPIAIAHHSLHAPS